MREEEPRTEETDGRTIGGGNKGRRTEKRGPKRSRAADGDVIGLVHLLRYIHGYQRTTSKGVREEMRRTGCGAAWEQRDWKQYASEGREWKGATAGGDGFDSGDEDGGAGGGRKGRAETTRERMRDEEWETRHYREYEERDDDVCEVERAAAAVAAGDDDELLRELEDSTAQGGACSDKTTRKGQGDDRVAEGRGEEEGEQREYTNKRDKAGNDGRSEMQRSSREGKGKPGTSGGETEMMDESQSKRQERKSNNYKANKGKKGKGKRE